VSKVYIIWGNADTKQVFESKQFVANRRLRNVRKWKLPSKTVKAVMFTTRCHTKIILVKPCREILSPPIWQAPRVPQQHCHRQHDLPSKGWVTRLLVLSWRSDSSGFRNYEKDTWMLYSFSSCDLIFCLLPINKF